VSHGITGWELYVSGKINFIKMALIKCTECGREISDKASACPSCGNPMNGTTVQIANPTGQTLKIEPELTSKGWKQVKIIAWCIIIGSLFIGPAISPPNQAGYAIFGIAFIGFIVLIIGSIGAWYADKRTR
jgi:hypothetical protein